MPWEDENKSYIELLISNGDYETAYRCLQAYIADKGEDYWAKNTLRLVEDKLRRK